MSCQRHRLACGTSIAYDVWGDASRPHKLLILPGVGNTIASMGFLKVPLTRIAQCLVVEHRGTGGSSMPTAGSAWPHASMEVFADDAWQLVQAMGWSAGKVSLLGTSFGGLVAQEIMLTHPAQVERAVLVSCGLGYQGKDELHSLLNMPEDERVKTMLLISDKRRDEEWLSGSSGELAIGLMKRSVAASRDTPGFEAGWRYQLDARAAFDARPRWCVGAGGGGCSGSGGGGGGSPRPAEESTLLGAERQEAAADATAGARMGPRTLCVWAVHDGIAPIETATQIRDALPGSTLCLFDSGHWPIMAQEDPEPFCRMLTSFLEGRGVPQDVAARSDELSEQWLGGLCCGLDCTLL